LARTTDGGYILAGQTFSFLDSTSDTYLVKTDADGNQQWMKTIGSDTLDGANSILQTSDGGYFITNHTEGYGAGDCDAWMCKTDAVGNVLWNQTYGCPDDDLGLDAMETSDHFLVACGVARTVDPSGDAFIAKYSLAGDVIWIKNYGGQGGQDGWRITEAPDGGYVVAGNTIENANGPVDIFVFKTDADGILLWSHNYGGPGEEHTLGLCRAVDGGYIVCGSSTSFGAGDEDAYLLKIDENGNQQWSRNYGGPLQDEAMGIVASNIDGYALTGFTKSFGDPLDAIIVKTDAFGNQQWMKTYGDNTFTKECNWIVACNDGGYAMVGSKQRIGSLDADLYFVKTDSEGNTSLNVPGLTGSTPRFIVFPDPAINIITLSFDNLLNNPDVLIYNAYSKLVFEGRNEKKINIESLPEGVYFISLRQDEKIYSQHFIKM
ncbi:MAG: T9SS type A sorting domain-containing protein, partial [Bacteroidota bacterium]